MHPPKFKNQEDRCYTEVAYSWLYLARYGVMFISERLGMEGYRIRNKELSWDHNHKSTGSKEVTVSVVYPSNNNN